VNLTKNFTFEEMTKSETALRFSMGNHPGDTELQNLIMLCEEGLATDTQSLQPGCKG
jgi:hypothetical protein